MFENGLTLCCFSKMPFAQHFTKKRGIAMPQSGPCWLGLASLLRRSKFPCALPALGFGGRWRTRTPKRYHCLTSIFWTAALTIRRIFRVDGKPEGTLTLALYTGECVAVPAACRLINMKNTNTQLQKAAVVPMAGVEPAPSDSHSQCTSCCATSAYRPVLPGHGN